MRAWVRRRNTRTKIESIGTNTGNTNHMTGLVRGPEDGVMATTSDQERNAKARNGIEMRSRSRIMRIMI